MTRESRANVIFLSIMLAICLPGMVMLAVKKYKEPDGPMMMQPPDFARAVAYMDPTPGLMNLPRIVPPQTNAWVSTVASKMARTQGLTRHVRNDGPWDPIMSRRLNVQLLAEGVVEGRYTMDLLLWHEKATPLPGHYLFLAHNQQEKRTGVVDAIQSHLIPIQMRAELQSIKFVRPPATAVFVQVSFDTDERPETLSVDYIAAEATFRDELVMPSAGPDNVQALQQ